MMEKVSCEWPNVASEVLGRNVHCYSELTEPERLSLLSAYLKQAREGHERELGRRCTDDEWQDVEREYVFPCAREPRSDGLETTCLESHFGLVPEDAVTE